jgi:hypothetical protein
MTTTERFFAKVDKTGDCWIWTGSPTQRYGQFYVNGQQFKAHRWAYELLVGPIPDGLSIDHLCRTPKCVRPDHLEPVSHKTNVLRGAAPTALNAIKTHCPQGHPYDEENTHVNARGWRQCRACRLVSKREGMRRARAARGSAKRTAVLLEVATQTQPTTA